MYTCCLDTRAAIPSLVVKLWHKHFLSIAILQPFQGSALAPWFHCACTIEENSFCDGYYYGHCVPARWTQALLKVDKMHKNLWSFDYCRQIYVNPQDVKNVLLSLFHADYESIQFYKRLPLCTTTVWLTVNFKRQNM